MKIIKIPIKDNNEKNKSKEVNDDVLYEFICQCSKKKYEHELRRESSIIQQASHMQAAFSFIIAALVMAAPVIVENRGKLSLPFLLVAFSSIIILLMLCLLFATIAQNRKVQTTLPIAEEHTKYIIENKKKFITKTQREKYLSTIYEEFEKSLHSNNSKRVKNVRISMLFFYIALGACFFWFVVSIIKLV